MTVLAAVVAALSTGSVTAGIGYARGLAHGEAATWRQLRREIASYADFQRKRAMAGDPAALVEAPGVLKLAAVLDSAEIK